MSSYIKKTGREIRGIRRWLALFIFFLFMSGLTAIPVDPQLSFLLNHVPAGTSVHSWLQKVLDGYRVTRGAYPFLLYGYDWLAFAHFILALLFYGAWKDPVRNIWVIRFGIIACILVIPYAFIAGSFRGIPAGWRLIDSAFGLAGMLPLMVCYHKILKISSNYKQTTWTI